MATAKQQMNRQSHKVSDKGARRRMRLLTIIVLGFVAWAAVTFIQQAEFVGEKAAQLATLEKKLAETRNTNEKLKLEITRLNDPEYIEQKAKKDQQMVRDGETLFTEPESSQ